MSEPICPECEGTGKPFAYITIAGIRHDKCPLCNGAGIATDDEAKEFDDFCKFIDEGPMEEE